MENRHGLPYAWELTGYIPPDTDGRIQLAGHFVQTRFESKYHTVENRLLRMHEEVCEACQAAGIDPDLLRRNQDFVYGREPGDLVQEVAGMQFTLWTVAFALQVNTNSLGAEELSRVLKKPREQLDKAQKVRDDERVFIEGPSKIPNVLDYDRLVLADPVPPWIRKGLAFSAAMDMDAFLNAAEDETLREPFLQPLRHRSHYEAEKVGRAPMPHAELEKFMHIVFDEVAQRKHAKETGQWEPLPQEIRGIINTWLAANPRHGEDKFARAKCHEYVTSVIFNDRPDWKMNGLWWMVSEQITKAGITGLNELTGA